MVRWLLGIVLLGGCTADFDARCGDDDDCPAGERCRVELELCWPAESDGTVEPDAAPRDARVVDDGSVKDGSVKDASKDASVDVGGTDTSVDLDGQRPPDVGPDARPPQDGFRPPDEGPPAVCTEGLYTARVPPGERFEITGRAETDLAPGRVRVAAMGSSMLAWEEVGIPPGNGYFVEARARVVAGTDTGAAQVALVLGRGGAVVLGFDGARAGLLRPTEDGSRPEYAMERDVGLGWHVFRAEVNPDRSGRVLVDGEEIAMVGAEAVSAWALEAPEGATAIRWGHSCSDCVANVEWDYVRWGCDDDAGCGPPDPEDDEICNGADDDCNGLLDDPPGGEPNLYAGHSELHPSSADQPALTLIGHEATAQAWRDANENAWLGFFDIDGQPERERIGLGPADALALAWSGDVHDGALLALAHDRGLGRMMISRFGRRGDALEQPFSADGILQPPAVVATADGWAIAAIGGGGGDDGQVIDTMVTLALMPRVGMPPDDPGGILVPPVLDGRVALATSGDGYAVAWSSAGPGVGNGTILVALAGRNGQLGRPFSAGGRNSVGVNPSLAWDGEAWLVVWERQGGRTSDIRYSRVSTRGELLTNPRALVAGDARETSPSVAWNGREMAVAYEVEGQVRMIHFDRAGRQVDPPGTSYLLHPPGIRMASEPVLAWDGTQYHLSFAGVVSNEHRVFTTRGPIGGCPPPP